MIDKSKTYRTRDGREVRIYATDGCAESPVHGAYQDKFGWRISRWFSNGEWSVTGTKDELDLIEVRPRHKRTVWLNMYKDRLPNECVQIYSSKEVADRWATHDRLACIKVDLDFEEGEGL
jgi:hypothetical protein